MSTALKLSVEEYVEMAKIGAFNRIDRRVELIRGELRESRRHGHVHSWLVTALLNWFFVYAHRHNMIVSCQVPLDLAPQDSMPEPDLMWLQKVSYQTRHPVWSDVRLAVEVADSSLQSDLTEKAELYAEAGIGEYWVVDAASKQIHVLRRPTNGKFAEQIVATTQDSVAPLIAPDAALSVSALFADEL